MNDTATLLLMLNISIPDQVQPFVEKQAADAGFSTVSDYIHYLIVQEQQRVAAMKDNSAAQFDPVALMRLPLTERRQILATQSVTMLEHYEQDADWREFTAGDIVEY